jgi:hypothetical protein
VQRKGVVERGKIIDCSRYKKDITKKIRKKVVRRREFYLVLTTLRPLHYIRIARRN